jgi:hypothetical protein
MATFSPSFLVFILAFPGDINDRKTVADLKIQKISSSSPSSFRMFEVKCLETMAES